MSLRDSASIPLRYGVDSLETVPHEPQVISRRRVPQRLRRDTPAHPAHSKREMSTRAWLATAQDARNARRSKSCQEKSDEQAAQRDHQINRWSRVHFVSNGPPCNRRRTDKFGRRDARQRRLKIQSRQFHDRCSNYRCLRKRYAAAAIAGIGLSFRTGA